MKNWTLSELAWWFENFDYRERLEDLGYPHPNIWPKDKEELETIVKKIRQFLPEKYHSYFYGSLLASFLLGNGPLFVEKLLKDDFISCFLGLNLGLRQLKKWRWQKINLVLANDKEAKIVSVLLGRGKKEKNMPWPMWAEKTLNQEAKETIYLICELLNDNNFFFWPQIFPGSNTSLINGTSLGLAVYLGFKSLQKNISIPPYIVCTGKINPNGEIGRVNYFEKKIEAVTKNNLTTLICPHHNIWSISREKKSIQELLKKNNFQIIPVRDVNHAWDVFKCNTSPEEAAFLVQAENPNWFVHNITNITLKTLEDLETQSNYSLKIMGKITGNEELLKVFIDNLHLMVSYANWPRKKVEFILRHYLNPTIIQKINHNYPRLAYNIAKLHLKRANLTGDVESSKLWLQKLEELFARLDFSELEQEEIILFVNKIIAEYHNRYMFETKKNKNKLTEDQKETLINQSFLENKIGEAIKFLEKRWEKISINKNISNALLGQFYGTMAQHFGYCKELSLLEKYVQKALIAFGRGKLPRYRKDWEREHLYLVYGYLDAKKFKKALSSLKIYLGTDLYPFKEPDNPYKHAALMRFMADTGFNLPIYLKESRAIISKIETKHPWQLWLFNLGRVVKNKKFKKLYWEESVKMCLNAGSQTITPMALLGLSHLWHNNLLDHGKLKSYTQEVLSNLKKSFLSKKHFNSILIQTNWEDVLRVTYTQLEQLFPFSYR